MNKLFDTIPSESLREDGEGNSIFYINIEHGIFPNTYFQAICLSIKFFDSQARSEVS